jgi:hypothetical protein
MSEPDKQYASHIHLQSTLKMVGRDLIEAGSRIGVFAALDRPFDGDLGNVRTRLAELQGALLRFDNATGNSHQPDDADEFFRVYAFEENRTLTAADIADIQKVLGDYNDEIGNQANLYQQAREHVLREIGGEELVRAAARADDAQSTVAVDRALAHFYKKAAEFEAKAPASNLEGQNEA